MPLPSSVINIWPMLHKLSTPWDQTGRHDHETFLTSGFRPANVKLRLPPPCQPHYRVISPVRTQNEDIPGGGWGGGTGSERVLALPFNNVQDNSDRF